MTWYPIRNILSYSGSPGIRFSQLEDMLRYGNADSDLSESGLEVSTAEGSRFNFTVGKDDKYLLLVQRAIPMSSIRASTITNIPENNEAWNFLDPNQVHWGVECRISPPGKPCLMSICYVPNTYNDSFPRNAIAGKAMECVMSLWTAYYEDINDGMRRVAACMKCGSLRRAGTYDPLTVPRGTMPDALREIRENNIRMAMQFIYKRFRDGDRIIPNENTDMLLYTWWMGDWHGLFLTEAGNANPHSEHEYKEARS